MSEHTDIVPFVWTDIDGMAASLGASVTPYVIPAAVLPDAPTWDAGQTVFIPLGRTTEPATVARFFREGYEWVDLPDGAETASTLVELFATLFAQDEVRFAHFNPVLVTATAALQDAAEVQAAIGGTMVAKKDPTTGYSPPVWLTIVHTVLKAAEDVLQLVNMPFHELARLHLEYWENSTYRWAVLQEKMGMSRVSPPKTWNFDVLGILGPRFPIPLFHKNFNPGYGLLAALLPEMLPVQMDAGGQTVKLPKVLARKAVAGVPIQSIATIQGREKKPMTVVSLDPPRIELDGFGTQTLAPFYLNDWKTRASKIRFLVTLPVPAAHTRFEIVRRREVIYAEQHDPGEFLVPGPHIWSWDGYDNDGVFDTRVLRSNELSARVTVTDLDGRVAVGSTQLGSGPGNIRWCEARLDTKNRTVEVTAYMQFQKPSSAKLGDVQFPLPAGVGKALGSAISELGADPALSLKPLFPGGGSKLPGLGGRPAPFHDDSVMMSANLPTWADLDPTTHALFKSMIWDGIQEHWTGKAPLDGQEYQIEVSVVERATDSFGTFLSKALPKILNDLGLRSTDTPIGSEDAGSRSFNLAAFAEGLPIIYIWDDLSWSDVLAASEGTAPSKAGQQTLAYHQDFIRCMGAHEFGHSVLREGYDPVTSSSHKGVTTPTGTTIAQVNLPGKPALGDIMYYFTKTTDDPDREVPIDDDRRALVWMAKVVFG